VLSDFGSQRHACTITGFALPPWRDAFLISYHADAVAPAIDREER
jgi:hypothetical protein